MKKHDRLLAIAEALLLALILGSTLVVSRLALNGLGPTAFWSWLFLGERLQSLRIFAMVVVIGGVALMQVSRHREA